MLALACVLESIAVLSDGTIEGGHSSLRSTYSGAVTV
jgi:hypothetical protein